MAIGWKCQYGYIPSDLFESLDSFSKFTPTDTGYYCFSTSCNIELVPNGQDYYVSTREGEGTTYYNTPGECSVMLEKILGENFYTWYVPSLGEPDTVKEYEKVSTIVPSAFLMCPNLVSYFKSEPGTANVPAIYFNTLNKLIANNSGKLYDVKNGNLTLIADDNYLPNFLVNTNGQGKLSILCFTAYDGTVDSILNLDNMLLVQADAIHNPRSQGCCINKITDDRTLSYLRLLFKDFVTPDTDIPNNPYQSGGPSGSTQPINPYAPGYLPPGTFDDSSDSIPDSSLPTLSAANTGFTRIYNPTLAQVQDLARYLWTDETVIQTIWNHIKQYFEDPMQAIIGFNLVPCTVPNAGSQNFTLMYIDTGVSMNVAANQFVDVDCGTVKLDRYYGSALDQSPHTRVSCFLPFIGTVRLNTDEVMGTTLSVKYRIDICSGSCVSKILVDGNVIYQYSGHCAINIPFSSADFSSYVSSAISVARLAIGAGVAGSAGAAAASVADPEQQTNRTVTVNRTTTTTSRNPSTGRQITTGTRTVSETRSYPLKQKEPQDTTQASFNALSPENISNTVGQIMASKPSIEHSGSFSGNTGYLGVRRPYLLIERPNMCMPEQYQQFNGFPAMITMNLSTCKGFTRVYQVQLTGMSATNPEQAEILSLLKSGVYF